MRRIFQVLIFVVDVKDFLVLIVDGVEKILLVFGFVVVVEFVVGEVGIVILFQVFEFDFVQFFDVEEVSVFVEGIFSVDQGYVVVLGLSLVGIVVFVDQKEETKFWWVGVVTARGVGLVVEWVVLEIDFLFM